MAAWQNFDGNWGTPYNDYAVYPYGDITGCSHGSSDAPSYGYTGYDSQGLFPGYPNTGPTTTTTTSGPIPGHNDYYWGKGPQRQSLLRGNLHRGRSEQYGLFTSKSSPYWEPTDEKWYPYHV